MGSEISLASWYKHMVDLSLQHKYSLSEYSDLIPFERDILITLINAQIKEDQDESQ